MFSKILIANRGEIAVRIIRACQELDILTVAVYSDADVGALHVRMANEAFPIGPAPSKDSYLAIEKIIDVARHSGAQGIHPGYGFLAENSKFAMACEENGITFIGPSSVSIALMGSKIESRRAVAKNNVSIVPGTMDFLTSDIEALEIAERIGFPLMLKASSGGGGKGMRYVESPDEMENALRATRAEALSGFGDDAIYIEKFIERPRHVEIQILADQHGNAIHLGERECTIQRRHQKVLEESPSPIITDDQRDRMGEAALRVVAAASYYNAGTVEFILDQKGDFYFLEMNTRLQVEHPITEALTGIDIVKQQIYIASGEKLAISQKDVSFRGSAIECRIYAEDPQNNFFPCPGRISRLQVPAGPGIRNDSGVYAGWDVPLEYDPLLAKLIAWAPSRDEAIMRMRRALNEYEISGIRHNIAFFKNIMDHPEFVSGDFDTGSLKRWIENRPEMVTSKEASTSEEDLAILAAALLHSKQVEKETNGMSGSQASEWKRAGKKEQLRQHRS